MQRLTSTNRHSACFVDLLKPGRDGDLVTRHFHHAMLDQERQGAFNFLGCPAGTEVIDRLRHFPQHLSLADRLQGGVVLPSAVGDHVQDFVRDHIAFQGG